MVKFIRKPFKEQTRIRIMELKQSQGLTQKLTPQLLQSINILQMNIQELNEYVLDVVGDNPVLDVTESGSDASITSEYNQAFDWLVSNDYQNYYYYSQDSSNDAPDFSFDAPISYYSDNDNLSVFLWSQFISKTYSPAELEALRFLIDRLNADGFLTEACDALAYQFGCSDKQMQKCIDILKTAEPIGIGAKDIKECLLMQAKAAPSANQDAIIIINDYLEDLAANRFKKICTKMKISEIRLHEAISFIKCLNPIPTVCFKNNEMPQYINPDIFLEFTDNGYIISMNKSLLPNIVVSSFYTNLLKTTTDASVEEYLASKSKQAKWVISSIEQRQTTVYKCASLIIERQINYLKGTDAYLKPLTLSDVASQLNIHESTVSRAISNKYLQCDKGIFLLNDLLSRHVKCNTDSTASTEAVKLLLEKHISTESKIKPLSDQKLSDLLSEAGYRVSRRTVTKYREELGIPAAYVRKLI